MRLSRTARAAGLLACVSLVGLLSACSSSGHDAVTLGAAKGAAAGGSEAGSQTSGSAGKVAVPAQQRVSSENGAVTVPTKKVLVRLTPSAVKAYKLSNGSATAQQRLAATTKSVKGTTVGVTYYHVSNAGQDVADIAVYRFKAAASTSKTFQGQIVSQLVTTAAKNHKVKFDKLSGSLFTVAGTSPVAVGTFRGQSAVVVLAHTGSQSLKSASAAALAFLQG